MIPDRDDPAEQDRVDKQRGYSTRNRLLPLRSAGASPDASRVFPPVEAVQEWESAQTAVRLRSAPSPLEIFTMRDSNCDS